MGGRFLKGSSQSPHLLPAREICSRGVGDAWTTHGVFLTGRESVLTAHLGDPGKGHFCPAPGQPLPAGAASGGAAGTHCHQHVALECSQSRVWGSAEASIQPKEKPRQDPRTTPPSPRRVVRLRSGNVRAGKPHAVQRAAPSRAPQRPGRQTSLEFSWGWSTHPFTRLLAHQTGCL